MFNSYIEKGEPFGSLTMSGSCLDNYISVLTIFSVFVVCRSAVTCMQKTTTWNVSVLDSGCLYLHFYFLSFQENRQNRISKAGETIFTTISLFFLK